MIALTPCLQRATGAKALRFFAIEKACLPTEGTRNFFRSRQARPTCVQEWPGAAQSVDPTKANK